MERRAKRDTVSALCRPPSGAINCPPRKECENRCSYRVCSLLTLFTSASEHRQEVTDMLCPLPMEADHQMVALSRTDLVDFVLKQSGNLDGDIDPLPPITCMLTFMYLYVRTDAKRKKKTFFGSKRSETVILKSPYRPRSCAHQTAE